MAMVSPAVVNLAPGATITWEYILQFGNQYLPPLVFMAKPEPLTPGFAGVFLAVTRVTTTIMAVGADAAYVYLVDVTNLAQTGSPIPHRLVIASGQ